VSIEAKAAMAIERAALLRAAEVVCCQCAGHSPVHRDPGRPRNWFHESPDPIRCPASQIHSLLSDDPILGDERTER
jgi:hypothetical protein